MPAFLTRLIDWFRDRFDPIVQAPEPLITITRVSALGASDGSRRLRLTFNDNRTGIVDLARHVEFVGTLAPLQDLAFFLEAYVDHGTVCWPGDIDMDAMVLYHLAFDMPVELTHDQGASTRSNVEDSTESAEPSPSRRAKSNRAIIR